MAKDGTVTIPEGCKWPREDPDEEIKVFTKRRTLRHTGKIILTIPQIPTDDLA